MGALEIIALHCVHRIVIILILTAVCAESAKIRSDSCVFIDHTNPILLENYTSATLSATRASFFSDTEFFFYNNAFLQWYPKQN